MRRNVVTWAIMLLVVCSSSNANLIGYVSEGNPETNLYLIDFDNGERTFLGDTGVSLLALDLSPVNGDLYAGDGDGILYQINPHTGLASKVMDTGCHDLFSFAFAPNGILFAFSYSRLISIDVETKQVCRVLPPSFNLSVQAFAIDDSGRAITWDVETQSLYEIDLRNGSTTYLGHLYGNFLAFDYGPDDKLYAVGYAGDTRFYKINTDTLQAELYNEYSYPRIPSFTFVPEPASAAIMTLASLFIALKRKRR